MVGRRVGDGATGRYGLQVEWTGSNWEDLLFAIRGRDSLEAAGGDGLGGSGGG
jgi:hypothetical protein